MRLSPIRISRMRAVWLLLFMLAAPPLAGQTLRLELNVPAYRLDVWRGDSLVRTFRVAVGMRSDPTPAGEFVISDVTWNPWWHPPQRAWARKDTIMAPGPQNPMGVLKLFIGGLYYLHGTPFASSMGRAASHGCVRMRQADAVALARMILRAQPGAEASGTAADSASIPEGTIELTLTSPVAIVVRYALIERAGDSLRFYPDIYRHRPRGNVIDGALAALAALDIDTAAVDRAKLLSTLRRSASRRTSIQLRALMVPSSAPR